MAHMHSYVVWAMLSAAAPAFGAGAGPAIKGHTVITNTNASPYVRLRGVPMEQVRLDDSFWAPRWDQNRAVVLPHQDAECERTGRIDNFRRAAGLEMKEPGGFRGAFFNDSDVYKLMEAMAYTLAETPDPGIEKRLNELIALVGAVQQPDGYLNTYFMFDLADKRWTDLGRMHELYLGGHMIQAAIAHHRATGRREFLDIACRWADMCAKRFGPEQVQGVPGHEEVEMALVELYRETGRKRYLDLALFFINGRGHGLLGGSPDLQDYLPVRQQHAMTGHAVRQMYLCCGMADAYAETGDPELLNALMALWNDYVSTKEYITGGAGARHEGEAFGESYELPNGTAYAETCAAIGSIMWNWRMLQITGEARFADVIERALYNGFLSGVALDGKAYFYDNPLEHDGKTQSGAHGTCRRTTVHFDECACCPPNVARTVASLPALLYGTEANTLYVHQYVQSEMRVKLAHGPVSLRQETAYPWDGHVRITIGVEQPVSFVLMLRYPGWAQGMSLRVNGEAADAPDMHPGSYTAIDRHWNDGDVIDLELPMPVEQIEADPRVAAARGCIALRRGPIVYCLEQADQPELNLFSLALRPGAGFTPTAAQGLPDSIIALTGEGLLLEDDTPLYSRTGEPRDACRSVRLTAIPYFAWANRSPGAMRVWQPIAP